MIAILWLIAQPMIDVLIAIIYLVAILLRAVRRKIIDIKLSYAARRLKRMARRMRINWERTDG